MRVVFFTLFFTIRRFYFYGFSGLAPSAARRIEAARRPQGGRIADSLTRRGAPKSFF